MSRIDFALSLTFDSDWHVGEGAGQPGHIDRIVRRGTDGIPYVPAKTIIGIWRDACEAVAMSLDGGSPGGWCAVVEALFGSEVSRRDRSADLVCEARLEVRPARFPSRLLHHLATSTALRQALTFIKPSIRIDWRSGQALDKHLRFEEVVRGGSRLEAPVTLHVDGLSDTQIKAATALLWAGTQAAERLGGKRRRGMGRCQFSMGADMQARESHVAILSGEAPVFAATALSSSVAPAPSASVSVSYDEWMRVAIELTLQTPVIVPEGTYGNVVACLDFVPGTYLLGHVSQVLGTLVGASVVSAIARGDVCVLNAYADVNGERGRPAPLALFRAKDGGTEMALWNRFREPAPQGADATQLKQVRSGYVGAFNAQSLPDLRQPAMQQTTHSTIDDERQRPTEEVGGVFTYEAMSAGTVLRGELRLRGSLARELSAQDTHWPSRLTGAVRLGVAKKDDYGLAKLSVGDLEPVNAQPTTGDTLVLWLLSDLLLRDDHLRPCASVARLTGALSDRLAVPLSPRPTATTTDKPLAVLLRTRRTDGWQVRWKLPRPPYVGLMAGSCAAFDLPDGLTPDKRGALAVALRQLECEGLGERRAEGFGEIAFNHPLLTASLSQLPATSASSSDSPPIPALIASTDPAHAYARIVERAAWRASIRRIAASLGADATWRREHLAWKDNKPANSQLGALRSAIATLQAASADNAVTAWLHGVEATANRRDKWPDAARAQLRTLATQGNTVWEWLGERGEHDGFPVMTATGTATLRSELWAEAVRAVTFAAIRSEQRRREEHVPLLERNG
jgi:CRISPR-associated protein Csx10